MATLLLVAAAVEGWLGFFSKNPNEPHGVAWAILLSGAFIVRKLDQIKDKT